MPSQLPSQLTVVAFGDSTTAPRAGVTVYPDLLQEHWRAHQPPVRVVNAGVRGDHTEGALARMALDVLAHAPHVVVLRFGINDSAIDVWESPPARTSRVPLEKFRRNLIKMIDSVRAIDGVPILCTPNPLAWHAQTLGLYGKSPYLPADVDGFNVTLREYVAAIRVIAKEYSVPLVDLDVAFRHYVSEAMPPWDALLLDGMHPNDAGHRLAADCLIPVLDKTLESFT